MRNALTAAAAALIVTALPATSIAGAITGSLTLDSKWQGSFAGDYTPGYPGPPYLEGGGPDRSEESAIVALGDGWLDWGVMWQSFEGMMSALTYSLGAATFTNKWHAHLEYVPSNGNDIPSGSYKIGYRLSDVASESVFNGLPGPTYGLDNVRWSTESLLGGRLSKPTGSIDLGLASYYFYQVSGSNPTGTLNDMEGGEPGTYWAFARVKFHWVGAPTNKWLSDAYLYTGVGCTQWAEAHADTSMGFIYNRQEQVELYSVASGSNGILRGTIDLNGGNPDKLRGKGIIVDYRETGTSSVAFRAVLTPELDGSDYVYEIPAPDSSGTYDLSIQYDHCLRKTITIDTSDLPDPLNIELLNGDVNLDNTVDIGDYAVCSGSFGMDDSDPDWSTPDTASTVSAEDCDLDGDGEITVGDYGIISTNWGEEGDD
jgi:hypothetical protein